MRKSLKSKSLHAYTMHAKGWTICCRAKIKSGDGEQDNSTYLVTSDIAYLTDNKGIYLITK